MINTKRVNLPLAICSAISILVILASPANADSGLPMLAVVWPASWILLIGIIPIEAAIAVRVLKTGWRQSLIAVFWANLSSTILGIPVTWLGMTILQYLFFISNVADVGHLPNGLQVTLFLVWGSSWLMPVEADLNWMIPAAAAVLCIPFFFMSVVIECFCIRRFFFKENKLLVWRWAWIANGITYGFIVLSLLGYLTSVFYEHSNEKFGFIDAQGRILVPPAGTSQEKNFAEGLAPVKINGKWGYIDSGGKCVVPSQFDVAQVFSNGLAYVEVNSGKQREHGFIDRNGNLVINLSARQLEIGGRNFWAGNKFSEGLCCVGTKTVGGNACGKYGFIDKSGKFAIEPQYDYARNFSEGLAAVALGKKWGYIDKNGKLVQLDLPNDYLYAFDDYADFSDGLGTVGLAPSQDGYIDQSGNVVIRLPENFAGFRFAEGMAEIYQGRSAPYASRKCGYIDKTGKVVIQPSFSYDFDEAGLFSDGLARVNAGTTESRLYGYIDKCGRFVVKPSYKDANRFSEGLAAVKINNKWGFIDRQGKIIIKPQFSQVGQFHEGLAAVGQRWTTDLP